MTADHLLVSTAYQHALLEGHQTPRAYAIAVDIFHDYHPSMMRAQAALEVSRLIFESVKRVRHPLD